MTILRVDTIAGTGTTFGPLLDGNLEFNSQNYIVLPKGSSNQQGVLRTTEDVIGVGGTYYDNLVLAMPFNEATGLRDVSSRNRNPGNYGNVAISTAQSKYYGSSAYFDGSGDYMEIAGIGSDFYFGSENFTIEGWINPLSIATDYQTIFVAGYPFQIYTYNGNIESYFNDSDDTSTYIIDQLYGPVNSIAANTWSHFAVVRNGSTFRCYVNGTSTSSKTSSSSLALSAKNLTIGGVPYNSPQYNFNGYLQDLRIYKGIAKYTADFTPPERIAETGVGFKTGALRYNTDSNKPELYDGNQWTELQISNVGLGTGGDTSPGARGVFGLTYNPSINNTLNYLTISSTGNALDFGDLSTTRHGLGSAASSTRGVFYAGEIPPGGVYTNTIDYITISSTGESQDFGDASGTLAYARGVANSTRGVFGGGRNPSIINTIEYITIASTGDTKDFGDLTQGREGTGTFASSVRGVYFGGGITTPVAPGTLSVNTVNYITLSTLSNATDFGDLTEAVRQTPGASNATRGLRFGGALGPALTNTIDYTQISTLGNFSNFGDLISASGYGSAAASSTRIVLGTGYAGSYSNSIEYVTISTLGNSVDFGDFTQNGGDSAAVSNAHGGL